MFGDQEKESLLGTTSQRSDIEPTSVSMESNSKLTHRREPSFVQIITANDIDALKRLLKNDSNPVDMEHIIQCCVENERHAMIGLLLNSNQGFNINRITRVYAEKGDYQRVKALLLCGASMNYALLGYARTSKYAKVKELLERGAHINYAVLGYAIAGKQEEVSLHIRLKMHGWQAIRGYAAGGYILNVIGLINSIIASEGDDIKHIDTYLAYAVQGFAEGGHDAIVDKFLTPDSHNNESDENLSKLLNLINEYVNDRNIELFVRHAIQGYAQSNQQPQFSELLKRYPSHRFEAAKGFLTGGYYTAALWMLPLEQEHSLIDMGVVVPDDLSQEQIDDDDLLFASASGGHYKQTESLLKKLYYGKVDKTSDSHYVIAAGYVAGSHADALVRWLNHCELKIDGFKRWVKDTYGEDAEQWNQQIDLLIRSYNPVSVSSLNDEREDKAGDTDSQPLAGLENERDKDNTSPAQYPLEYFTRYYCNEAEAAADNKEEDAIERVRILALVENKLDRYSSRTRVGNFFTGKSIYQSSKELCSKLRNGKIDVSEFLTQISESLSDATSNSDRELATRIAFIKEQVGKPSPVSNAPTATG